MLQFKQYIRIIFIFIQTKLAPTQFDQFVEKSNQKEFLL